MTTSPPTAAETVRPRKVLMLVPALSMIYGGPTLTASRLTAGLNRKGVQVDVVTTNADADRNIDVPLREWIPCDNYRVMYFPRWGTFEYKISLSLLWWLWKHLREYQVLHTTSVFNFPVLAGAAVAQMRGVPYVINPAGMLEPWALAYKAWKKRWYYKFFEKPRLEHASAIHCLTVPEGQRVEKLGVSVPLVVVPNGIDPEEADLPGDREVLFAQYPKLRDKVLILFMHRVDRKKGLDLLAPAFAAARQRLPDLPLHLVIAGPPTKGFLSTAKHFFEEAGCAAHVTFTGIILDDLKRAALAAASVFVTPTYSEGFSMSVLEAMMAGLPNVLTTGCNFPEAPLAGIAYETPIESAAFAEALIEMLANPERSREMGRRARQFILNHYTWDQAAARTVAIYTALINHTTIPYTVAACAAGILQDKPDDQQD